MGARSNTKLKYCILAEDLLGGDQLLKGKDLLGVVGECGKISIIIGREDLRVI